MGRTDRSSSRTFVVTGAASGIGLATARRLLAEGGTVVGTDLVAPAEDLGARFEFVAADITDETAVDGGVRRGFRAGRRRGPFGRRRRWRAGPSAPQR